jgi:hypothetical protein
VFMSLKTKLFRLLAGAGLLAALLAAGFSITIPWLHHAGASAAEVAAAYPGDELEDHPVLSWTIATTIDAPVQQVYPWLIQIGDTRGGYYSYMFIEQLIGGPALYHNADRIHPEWQNPPIGQGMIADMLVLRAYEPNVYVLAKDTPKMGGLTWTWAWCVEPIDAQHTRLINRMRIQTPASFGGNPAALLLLDAGGFVMEQNMMQGIAQRAGGNSELSFTEPLEIFLWLTALCAGLVAAWLFVNRSEWKKPMVVCVLTVAALFVLTFVQPPLWVRAAIDLGLVVGAVWASGKKIITASLSVKS